jgi:hypothetical protein
VSESTHADVSDSQAIEVRATIKLPNGLHAGGIVLVDPDDEYVRECLKAGYLVPVEDD